MQRTCQPLARAITLAISGVIVALLAARLARAQDNRPAYEVASIKPNDSGSGSSRTNGSKGQIVFTNQTLKRFIERAYNAEPFQVTGPGWLDGRRALRHYRQLPCGYKKGRPSPHAAHAARRSLQAGRASRNQRHARLCRSEERRVGKEGR